jgi:hypothetical protein
MVAGNVGGPCQQFLVDGMDVQPTPKALQVIEPVAKLRRSQAPPLAHPGQGGRCLDVRDRRAAHSVGIGVGLLGLLGPRLVDQQLDQGAGIEVEAQRRPSAT